jgi:5-methylcytosine-specific restriction endonuclease McrA
MKTLEEIKKQRCDYMREYTHRSGVKEKRLERCRKYIQGHKEQKKLMDKQYREKNKSKIAVQLKQWREKKMQDPEYVAEKRSKDREYARRKLAGLTPGEKKAVHQRQYKLKQVRRPWLVQNLSPESLSKVRANRRKSQARRKERLGGYSSSLLASVVQDNLIQNQGRLVCGLCFQPIMGELVNIDHIIPLAKGGLTVRSNLQVTHATCNNRKLSMLLGEWFKSSAVKEELKKRLEAFRSN